MILRIGIITSKQWRSLQAGLQLQMCSAAGLKKECSLEEIAVFDYARSLLCKRFQQCSSPELNGISEIQSTPILLQSSAEPSRPPMNGVEPRNKPGMRGRRASTNDTAEEIV